MVQDCLRTKKCRMYDEGTDRIRPHRTVSHYGQSSWYFVGLENRQILKIIRT